MVDSHAHIHFSEVYKDIHDVLVRAKQAGVTHIINVGVNATDSRVALKLTRQRDIRQGVEDDLYPQLFATAGLHPHEAAQADAALDVIHDMAEDVVAIGECGLDYFKNHASQSEQDHALRAQLDIASEHNLPVIFHVRDAWADFFEVLADYPKIRGVIHSFTGHPSEVEQALRHGGFYFGLNGIMTFTKDQEQLEAARLVPADKLLLETDSPYLAPPPHRGKRNEPAFVLDVAEFVATLRGEELQKLTSQTTLNAIKLFDLDVV